jgi:diguanylate cyclase (GGDEF)-like protein
MNILMPGSHMKKNDLKSLVNQMYNDLRAKVDSQTEADKQEIIQYLEDAILSLQSLDEHKLDSAEQAKQAFRDAYKTIAEQSIEAYTSTNKKFEELTNIQGQALEKYQKNLIDTSAIQEQFQSIQNYMMEEVQRANETITQLTDKVSELETTSNLDGLTQVFNRRALDNFISEICKKGKLRHDLHLLLLDIDDFKVVNDKYGHIAGDKILIFIANLLRKTLRDGDKLFRYGGEEFIIVLNRIDTRTAKLIARRILDLISHNKLFYKGESLKVTMSIGLTKYVEGDTPESLISRADKALYESKHNGKNQFNVELLNGI